MTDQQLPELNDLELPPVDDQALPDLDPAEGLSLADAAEGGPPTGAAPLPAKPTAPMDAEQIIGLVASLTGATLPPEVRAEYVAALKGDELVRFGVMASGMAEALAEYGIGADGGKLPAWAALLVGAGVLGYGVYNHRGAYAVKARELASPAAGGGPGGFDYGSSGGITDANLSPAFDVAGMVPGV